MKIALINESSQVSKNRLIFETLKETVEPLGHEAFNYGMSEDDPDYAIKRQTLSSQGAERGRAPVWPPISIRMCTVAM